ncbi:hypothetical protein [Roseovarius sp. EL26]|uniref:CBU_0592 family membrane protein n=1 Tax=Roseovarius sp. EL26 TaxID=2126672 RepID=UPI0013C47A3D|nr:hypothetical protein [Roseovarius sp. EL26]
MIIVIAYYLAARGILPADQSHFNLINIIGGGLVMASLLVRPDLGVIVIEVMFLLIAVLAIFRNWRAQRGIPLMCYSNERQYRIGVMKGRACDEAAAQAATATRIQDVLSAQDNHRPSGTKRNDTTKPAQPCLSITLCKTPLA